MSDTLPTAEDLQKIALMSKDQQLREIESQRKTLELTRQFFKLGKQINPNLKTNDDVLTLAEQLLNATEKQIRDNV